MEPSKKKNSKRYKQKITPTVLPALRSIFESTHKKNCLLLKELNYFEISFDIYFVSAVCKPNEILVNSKRLFLLVHLKLGELSNVIFAH